jgi:protein-L-isoaspartate(D-aspartate) O-methyltransferase
VSAQPVLFTVEFRRKMAELPYDQRQEWLTSLASQVGGADLGGSGVVAQELREVARGCRLCLVESVERNLGPFDPLHLQALLEVPRERFVKPEEVDRSAQDVPLPLDSEGLATISAPHAYLLSYRLLGLTTGDTLVELGTGSGYGAALAAFIVGPEGGVITFEIDAELAAWARRLLFARGARSGGGGGREPTVRVLEADAMKCASQWGDARKVVVSFAVDALPQPWLEALPEGGTLVGPVGPREGDQRLILATKRQGRIVESDHGAVRYVRNRSGASPSR